MILDVAYSKKMYKDETIQNLIENYSILFKDVEKLTADKFIKESTVAVRAGEIYLRKLESCKVKTINNREAGKETILVTGGTGLITVDICKEYSRGAQTNFAIKGRTKLEAEKEESAEKLALLQNIASTGAQAEYFCADVTDLSQMKDTISQINKKFGEITGVIHAAGTFDMESFKLLDKSTDGIKAVIAPKVKGTIVVDIVTREQPLQFFAMLSSVSATKKEWSGGLGDYAAANAFLDGYAEYRKNTAANGKSVAINYSLWADKGMGTRMGTAALAAAKLSGLTPLISSRAVKAFVPALEAGENVIHVFEEFKTQERQTTKALETTKIKVQPANAFEGSSEEVRKIVYDTISEYFSEQDIDVNTNFTDLGLDSIGDVSVVSSISNKIGIELYPTLVFEHQTPVLFADHIVIEFESLDAEPAKAEDLRSDIAISRNRNEENGDDIAVIGMGLRVPGAETPEEFWEILKNGESTISEIPKNRWNTEGLKGSNPQFGDLLNSYRGGFLRDIFACDPSYFGISPNEAKLMDPQQRIFLLVAAEALQRGGYAGIREERNVGVFVGSEQNSYMERFIGRNTYLQIKNILQKNSAFNVLSTDTRKTILSSILNEMKASKLAPDSVPGNALNQIACRVSHCFNFTGPSILMNSVCSSSLVAVHMACEMLRKGEIDMAIAGGVNVNTTEANVFSLNEVMALSKSGVCYPFDSRADGMVLSEGAGAVLLKPLSKALKDNDNIFAVIKGSAVGNDGHSQGILAPRPQGQAKTIEAAYKSSGISPESVTYVEAHGTGTPLGDPIEIEELTAAFRKFTDKTGYCGIGSVKSSIGHMLSASGVVSLIKVVLAMQHKTIPQSVNFEKPNEHIKFSKTPFYVAGSSMKWDDGGQPLTAAVNSFGFGGTNAHIILQETPKNQAVHNSDFPQPLMLTGKSEKVIKQIAAGLRSYANDSKDSVQTICRTLNGMQKRMTLKISTVVDNREDLIASLDSIIKDGNLLKKRLVRINPNRIVKSLLCLGNEGMDYVTVESFRKSYSIFNESYEKCLLAFENQSLENFSAETKSQISTFAMQYAFGMLLRHFEVSFTVLTQLIISIRLSRLKPYRLMIHKPYKIEHTESDLEFKCPSKFCSDNLYYDKSRSSWLGMTLLYEANNEHLITDIYIISMILVFKKILIHHNGSAKFVYCIIDFSLEKFNIVRKRAK
jgi:3-oxoacyl-(acyl-carrier-protein) synthase/NAD(P)-dependent dehydrogenase (short-subunit alcohol dehydrogenase family)